MHDDNMSSLLLHPDFLKILQLLSVKTFKADFIRCNASLRGELKPKSSPLENLIISNSTVTAGAMQPIVRCGKVLKKFPFSGPYPVL